MGRENGDRIQIIRLILLINYLCMNKTVESALNKQIQKEIASAYLYLSIAAYCEGKNLKGFVHWFEFQAKEEMTHAMKIYKYIYSRGGNIVLLALEQPKAKLNGPMDTLVSALEHEKYITAEINKIYKLSVEKEDYATQSFLKWFIDEQVEEEESVIELIEKLKLTGEKGGTFYMFDRELGKRE